ncbi:MAG: hypothetical protein JWP53_1983, partial [Conexibacter sp.]|nr:hypothetical protein [Conexibacter sp.]
MGRSRRRARLAASSPTSPTAGGDATIRMLAI